MMTEMEKEMEQAFEEDVKEAMDLLKHIDWDRPVSELSFRFTAFEEAWKRLTEAHELNPEEALYFAFCYAEERARRRKS